MRPLTFKIFRTPGCWFYFKIIILKFHPRVSQRRLFHFKIIILKFHPRVSQRRLFLKAERANDGSNEYGGGHAVNCKAERADGAASGDDQEVNRPAEQQQKKRWGHASYANAKNGNEVMHIQ